MILLTCTVTLQGSSTAEILICKSIFKTSHLICFQPVGIWPDQSKSYEGEEAIATVGFSCDINKKLSTKVTYWLHWLWRNLICLFLVRQRLSIKCLGVTFPNTEDRLLGHVKYVMDIKTFVLEGQVTCANPCMWTLDCYSNQVMRKKRWAFFCLHIFNLNAWKK